MSVRVRFAPSPTGFLHVGGLRTALYNYLFARKNNGSFILRIEDTDRTRLVENATENLIKSLSWAGIEFDESPVNGGDYGPYIQSERLDIYQKFAKILIENGSAYYAFDTSEQIEQMRMEQNKSGVDQKYNREIMRNQLTLPPDEIEYLLSLKTPYVIRLKVNKDEEVRFHDIIRGDVSVWGKEIDDQVLLKSDGFPTYHLANVVDDHLMKITHVIRGEEWLPSTPKHVLLYQAFSWDIPEFAHLPLLLNKDKTKLSKRQGDVAVEDYISKGYIRDAFVNFIALLGWNPSGDREIYSIEELIESFNLEKVNKGGAVFDIVKLDWMNSQYLRNDSEDELANQLIPILESNSISGFSNEYLVKIIQLFKERISNLKEIPEIASYMFTKPLTYEEEYYNKHWKENTGSYIIELKQIFDNTNDFNHTNLHDLVKEYVEIKGIKLKDIIHPLRLMITGRSTGAGMFETMEVLGKEECINRIDLFLKRH